MKMYKSTPSHFQALLQDLEKGSMSYIVFLSSKILSLQKSKSIAIVQTKGSSNPIEE